MNEDKQKEEELTRKLTHFLCGNIDAVRFCLDCVRICHVWDDLVDGDTRTPNDINDAFRIALIDIPSNLFYVQNMHHLKPIMMNVILQWQDANVLERESDHDKHMAYMLRASIVQLFNYCAYLTGGPEWARQIGPDLRRIYEEPLEDFMKEMENA